MIREMLRENIVREAGTHTVGVNFSGGTDSMCLLLAAMDVGMKPPLFTYAIEGVESEDLRRAKIAAARFDLPLTIALMPRDVEGIVRDVRAMKALGISGKVNTQCCHGHYVLAPRVTVQVLLNGSGIDGLYGTYKPFQLARKRISGIAGKAAFDAMRQKHLDAPNNDAMEYQRMLYGRCGVEVIYPYRQSNVISWIMSKTFEEINRPHLKAITLVEFPEVKEIVGFFRPRGAQQIVAGTREVHDILLKSEYNTKGWKNVNAIYERL